MDMHLKGENLASLNLQCLRNFQRFVKMHSLLQYGAGVSEILFLRCSKGTLLMFIQGLHQRVSLEKSLTILSSLSFGIDIETRQSVIQGSEGLLCTLGKKGIREFV